MKTLNPLSSKRMNTARFLMIFIFSLPLSLLHSQEGIVFSGVAKSTVGVLADSSESWNVAAEQYANFRITAPVGEIGSFYTAFNVLAVSTPETGLITEGEIERLYTAFRFDATDVNLGLMRIPFGYGMGIRPTDIINPQNPLFPDARLRGVLAGLITWYPGDDLQVQGFAVQKSNKYFEGQSISFSGESLFGFSVDHHNPIFSVQGLALTKIPGEQPDDYLLHFGCSFKIDVFVGFAFDALITTDGKTGFAEGRENAAIAAALSCDYSLLSGKLFLLAQYYYTSAGMLSSTDSISDYLEAGYGVGSGELSIQSLQSGGTSLLRRQYGFFTVLYNHSDYARLQLSVLASLCDASAFPTIRHEFEPVQAVTLISIVAIPLDMTVLGGTEKGEFGPDVVGLHAAASFSVEYRF